MDDDKKGLLADTFLAWTRWKNVPQSEDAAAVLWLRTLRGASKTLWLRLKALKGTSEKEKEVECREFIEDRVLGHPDLFTDPDNDRQVLYEAEKSFRKWLKQEIDKELDHRGKIAIDSADIEGLEQPPDRDPDEPSAGRRRGVKGVKEMLWGKKPTEQKRDDDMRNIKEWGLYRTLQFLKDHPNKENNFYFTLITATLRDRAESALSPEGRAVEAAERAVMERDMAGGRIRSCIYKCARSK